MKKVRHLILAVSFFLLIIMPIRGAWNITENTEDRKNTVEKAEGILQNTTAARTINDSLSSPAPGGHTPYGHIYLGAWLNGQMPDIYNEWVNQTGTGLAVWATFAVLAPDESVPSTVQFTLSQRLNEVLPWMKAGLFDAVCVAWSTAFTVCTDYDDGPNGTAFECTRRVANCEYDNAIRDNARWIKDHFPYRLIIRLNAEFDIRVWGCGKNATLYVAAWKQIVDIFRQENAQVEWCWSPNFESAAGKSYADYYPGDDYVDWIGVSIYANTWGWPNADEMLNAKGRARQNPVSPYEFSLLHNKPFMIAEWGLNITKDMSDEQNAAWLDGMFEAIQKRTNIRMIIHWGYFELFLLNYPKAIQTYRNYTNTSEYSVHYP